MELFPAQNIFYDYYNNSLANKIFFKIGISSIYHVINKQLLTKVDEYQPDVVWIFKGMEIFPETILALKEKSILVVNYNPDNPFIFSGKGSGNSNITKSISLYDLHFTYNLSIKKKLEGEYRCKTAFLPFGFELSEAQYRNSIKEKEILKICFLGNPDNDRAAFVRELADGGIEIDVYGNDWSHFLKHRHVKVFSAVYGDNFWKILRRYRIQLNLMRKHNEDSHNMRSFEIPGVGGIMLAADTAEHRFFFEEGKEIFLFSDKDDCLKKIKTILSLGQQRVQDIRDSARYRSVNSGYTYKDRTKQAIQELEKLYE
ncbi:MAG: glycosyltransferase family 1 protein [Bacteroidetes bacterium]|nr:glycosyltransferase family 1 protein [Bacteroidota bacterium]